MPKIDAKKYFFSIIAFILILGIAIASFVWQMLTKDSIENAENKLEINNESPIIMDPLNIGTPSGPPSVPFPEEAF
jgi:uncharacterized membrane protein